MRSDKGKKSKRNLGRKLNTVHLTFRCHYSQRITQNLGQIWKSSLVVEFGGVSRADLLDSGCVEACCCYLAFVLRVQLKRRMGVRVAKQRETVLSVSLWQLL